MPRCVLLLVLCIAVPVQAEQVLLDSQLHPLGESLRAVVQRPAGLADGERVPGCLVVHGSGGLFKENAPGEMCGPDVENNFQALMDLMTNAGVVAVAPSSFASRDARFCEDNDPDYFAFAPAPFFNPGDGVPVRDSAYSIRRVVIRTLDLLAASRYLCSLPEVDCSRTCMIGASNGGTTMMAFGAQDLGRHMEEFLDTTMQREHESSSSFMTRQGAHANFPAVPEDLARQLDQRLVPRFIQAVSPGCSLRQLVPTIDPADEDFDADLHRLDLYYPAAPTELHLEIGTADSVPEACYNGGVRELQARAFEGLENVARSRYRIQTYDGRGHDLLAEIPEVLHPKAQQLILIHLFPEIFRDGFEVTQE